MQLLNILSPVQLKLLTEYFTSRIRAERTIASIMKPEVTILDRMREEAKYDDAYDAYDE